MKAITPALTVAAVIGAAAILYVLAWPVEIDPAAWTPPPARSATGVLTPNDRLTQIETLARGSAGPESVAIDGKGYLYAGLLDGRIVRVSADGKTVDTYARAREPLGMEFDAEGHLVVADAGLGLVSVDSSGTVVTLTRQVDDTLIKFADDLAIASDGTIYFSDASTRFTNKMSQSDVFEHRPNGRLLAFDVPTLAALAACHAGPSASTTISSQGAVAHTVALRGIIDRRGIRARARPRRQHRSQPAGCDRRGVPRYYERHRT